MELIYIKDLSKAYGKTKVLDNLSVSYESGKIYTDWWEKTEPERQHFSTVLWE